MANPQHLRKVGAHSNQETPPCDPSSTRPKVAPDSQTTPTGRKREHRTLSSENQDTLQPSLDYLEHRAKRPDPWTKSRSTTSSSTHSSLSSWDRNEREYWDSLSRVWLDRGALREFNRRDRLLRAKAAPTADTVSNLKQRPKDIARFARHGGPDLSDIRQVRKLSSSPGTSNMQLVLECSWGLYGIRVNASKGTLRAKFS